MQGGATSSDGGPDEGQGGASGGVEPDVRFTLANERTFLAWNRTALALVVAGLGIVQLLPPFPGVPWGRHALGVPLIVLGAAVSVTAFQLPSAPGTAASSFSSSAFDFSMTM